MDAARYALARYALDSPTDLDLDLWTRRNDLLKALAGFPGVVASAAELRQTHRVARYLEDLAGAYHRFYDACRVLPRDGQPLDDLGRARLWQADAARIVLASGLGPLGVTAPDRL